MTDVEIRLVTPDDDMDAQADLEERAFGRYSPQQRANWTRVASLRASQGLSLGVFAGSQPVGGAMVHDLRQYWLGRAVPCAGVASVQVAPEHRGRGVGRRLMTELLAMIAERGYPLSALFPATLPVYRSLGWELAGGRYQAAVPARALLALLAPDPQAFPAGLDASVPVVRRATPADAATVLGVIGRSHQVARDAGPVTWDEEPTRQWLACADNYAYLVGEDGFVAYRWANGNDEIFVDRVHAATPQALRALWSVIASHSSVARTVRGLIAPGDPFWWLTREPDAAVTSRSMWMLRVVDAPAGIAARGFPRVVRATVPLVINDHACPANTGRWELSVADGTGTLTLNEAPSPALAPLSSARGGHPAPVSGQVPGTGSSGPDLTLGARGLAALYAGTPVAALRLAGLASGGTPEGDAALDAAFTATPYMVDDF